jgi:hypothetical protein
MGYSQLPSSYCYLAAITTWTSFYEQIRMEAALKLWCLPTFLYPLRLLHSCLMDLITMQGTNLYMAHHPGPRHQHPLAHLVPHLPL